MDRGSREEPGSVCLSPHRSRQKPREPREATASRHEADREKQQEPESWVRDEEMGHAMLALNRLYRLCNYSGGVGGQEMQVTAERKEGQGLNREEVGERGGAHLEAVQATFPGVLPVPDLESDGADLEPGVASEDALLKGDVEESTEGHEELAPEPGQTEEEQQGPVAPEEPVVARQPVSPASEPPPEEGVEASSGEEGEANSQLVKILTPESK